MADPSIDVVRQQFPSSASAIHLDHASVGPVSLRVARAMQLNADQHATSGFDPGWRDDIERVRADVAWLTGSRPDNVAFVQNTSFGLSIAANGIDWRPGDNVVLPAGEFTSNYYPWLNLQPRGVQLRNVACPEGHASIGAIAEAIDDRTRVVTVSAVQYSNGNRYDLTTLGDLCRERGLLFVVDGTQSVGALTICTEVRSRGYTVQSPRNGHDRSGIVIFSKSGTDPQPIHDRLAAAGVKCAVRAGGIRFSPHFYNTLDELDTALAMLS